MGRVRIPADVERDDRVLAGLTARQLAIVAVFGLAIAVVVAATASWLPIPAVAALATPIGAAGGMLALGRRDGLSGDRFALAAARHLLTPRRRVAAPEGVPELPAWIAPAADGGRPGPLGFPARTLRPSGVFGLGTEGSTSALICSASSVNFSLRSDAEQDALVAAFGRFLHALGGPVQIVVRAQRVDLTAVVAELEAAKGSLTHPGLAAAAAEHARFLASLGARRDVLRRQVLVVFTEPGSPTDAEDTLLRRVEETAGLLAAASITLTPLDGEHAAAALRDAADPHARPVPPGQALPDATIHGPGAPS